MIEPAFFRGFPPAVPHELEDACRAFFPVHGHSTDEVGAPGPRVELDALDANVGELGEELSEDADDLDRRRVPNADERRAARHAAPWQRRERANLALELVCGAGALEVLGEGHLEGNLTGAARGPGRRDPRSSGHTR